jgi:hypothetical protein
VTSEAGGDELPVGRRLTRLAAERGALFEKAGRNFGLSPNDQQRLRTIERELDECFVARRSNRASSTARRFERELPIPRRSIPPRLAR